MVHTAMQLDSPTSTEFQSVNAGRLRVGSTLRIPIYDSRDVLLLARGATITPNFLSKIANRGISEVKVHESELSRIYAGQSLGTASTTIANRGGHFCDLDNQGTSQLDEQIRRGGFLGLPNQGDPFSRELVTHTARTYDEEKTAEYVENREESINHVEQVYSSLANGRGIDVDQLSTIADEALSDLAGDCDLFASMSINPYSDKYPIRHSVHTCMLALSIGTQLGLDRVTLRELATGCLIHDAGMMQIEENVYSTTDVIDAIKFLEITKHPIFVFDMLKNTAQIPSRSAFIAYQIHERCDGSGYPRRREANQIHFLSKVAAVADSYIGLVSPRPHRPGMIPYRAVEKILRDTGAGLFDPLAARALLKTVSLFPIGSCVELDNGRVGRVIRSNGDNYNRPVVESWKKGQLGAESEVIDLATDPDRKILKPLPDLGPMTCEESLEDNWE